MTPDEDAIWRLYDHSLEMVDKQVDRQWSTSQFFILLSASTIAVALTLLQFFPTRGVQGVMAAIFIGGAFFAWSGIRQMQKAKLYYRTLVAKKTMLEHRLGLTTSVPGFERTDLGVFALGPLATRSKVREILANVDDYPKERLRIGSATGWAAITLGVIAIFDIVAAVTVIALMIW